MKVVCDSVEDFLANLRAEDLPVNDCLHRRSLFVQSVKTKKTEASNEVGIVVSAIVSDEYGQYLLHAEETCGLDYLDGDKETVGSDALNKLLKRLMSYCDVNKIALRPGIIGV